MDYLLKAGNKVAYKIDPLCIGTVVGARTPWVVLNIAGKVEPWRAHHFNIFEGLGGRVTVVVLEDVLTSVATKESLYEATRRKYNELRAKDR